MQINDCGLLLTLEIAYLNNLTVADIWDDKDDSGVSINFDASRKFSITGVYYFKRPSFLGGSGADAPPGKF